MVERKNNGQFAPGHKGGPGRPKKEYEQEYLSITQSSVSKKEWAQIVAKAVQQAIKGDSMARKWLSEYLMGRPPQAVELSGHDGGPVEVRIGFVDNTQDKGDD